MPTATPSLETVIDAVAAALGGIASLGTVLKREHHLEDDVEFLEVNGYISGGSLDLWFIDLEATSEFEGQGVGEAYTRYHLRIRYWSMRTNNADWSKEARVKAQSVCDALTDNAAVFEIAGQVQLFTPTTVGVASHGPLQIRDDARAAGQMIFETVLGLTVEARRWS